MRPRDPRRRKARPGIEKAALLIIDAQHVYFAPIGKLVLPMAPRRRAHRGPARLDLAGGVPVVHESRLPNPTTFVSGSFTNTGLEEHLRRHGIAQIIVSRFMTQMCCDTTAREAAHRGFKVFMAADAMAAMPVKDPDGIAVPHDQVHRTHPRKPERRPVDRDDVGRTDRSPACPLTRRGLERRRPPASPPTAS